MLLHLNQIRTRATVVSSNITIEMAIVLAMEAHSNNQAMEAHSNNQAPVPTSLGAEVIPVTYIHSMQSP
jgi:hypothetical protein